MAPFELFIDPSVTYRLYLSGHDPEPPTDAFVRVRTLQNRADAPNQGDEGAPDCTIALDPDDGLIAVDNDAEKAVVQAMTALTPGYELVTLFYGDGASLGEAEAMAKRIGTVVPGVEVEVRHGGQPYYRYLIAAE